jgi:hypothetical protein
MNRNGNTLLINIIFIFAGFLEVMIGTAHERFDRQGKPKDEMSKQFIRELLQNIVSLSRKIKST